MSEFGLTEKERVEALVESAYQVARERRRSGTDGSGLSGSLVFRLAREIEGLYEKVYGERGLLYQLEMTKNMLDFYRDLAEGEEVGGAEGDQSES